MGVSWRLAAREIGGRGEEKGIFHVYSGQMMEKSLVCVLGIGKGKLKPGEKGGTGLVSLGKQSWDVPF